LTGLLGRLAGLIVAGGCLPDGAREVSEFGGVGLHPDRRLVRAQEGKPAGGQRLLPEEARARFVLSDIHPHASWKSLATPTRSSAPRSW
jgi:hypothetical protein